MHLNTDKETFKFCTLVLAHCSESSGFPGLGCAGTSVKVNTGSISYLIEAISGCCHHFFKSASPILKICGIGRTVDKRIGQFVIQRFQHISEVSIHKAVEDGIGKSVLCKLTEFGNISTHLFQCVFCIREETVKGNTHDHFAHRLLALVDFINEFLDGFSAVNPCLIISLCRITEFVLIVPQLNHIGVGSTKTPRGGAAIERVTPLIMTLAAL